MHIVLLRPTQNPTSEHLPGYYQCTLAFRWLDWYRRSEDCSCLRICGQYQSSSKWISRGRCANTHLAPGGSACAPVHHICPPQRRHAREIPRNCQLQSPLRQLLLTLVLLAMPTLVISGAGSEGCGNHLLNKGLHQAWTLRFESNGSPWPCSLHFRGKPWHDWLSGVAMFPTSGLPQLVCTTMSRNQSQDVVKALTKMLQKVCNHRV
mmetsp:Transcript_25055/g.66421  ORF Transcript_25055/g.66421 Transcript_25055/m.66421 type:complete len:207 (-) Transcript_25055:87-707(-)